MNQNDVIIDFLLVLYRAKVLMESASEGEDCDVAAERQRVLSGGADDDILRVENLTKVNGLLSCLNSLQKLYS